MKIVITSKKPINDDIKGRLATNAVIDLPDHKAMFYIERGEAVRYETKVLQDNPLKTDGAVGLSSAARQVEVSPRQTLNLSGSGEKKKTAKRKQSS